MKLLIIIPGFGESNIKHKINFLYNNLQKIRNTYRGTIYVKLFNYSLKKIQYKIPKNIIFSETKEKGIVGQFIYKHITPEFVDKYDFDNVIIMLDDITLENNFNMSLMIRYYKMYNFNILSPTLTDRDSPYDIMIYKNSHKESIKNCNFCELFFYLLDKDSYIKYYNLLDKKSNWLWGLDLSLYLQGFKCGLINMKNFQIKHHYKGESYKNNLPDPRKEWDEIKQRLGNIEQKDVSVLEWLFPQENYIGIL